MALTGSIDQAQKEMSDIDRKAKLLTSYTEYPGLPSSMDEMYPSDSMSVYHGA